MRSSLTVSTAATVTRLVELSRVKQELNITDNSKDAILGAKIDEATSLIQAELGFTVAREDVVETFWHEGSFDSPEYIVLNRAPVSTVTSIVADDVAVDASLYRLDAKVGQVYALDSSGYPLPWLFVKTLVVTYTGGFLLPGQNGRDLEYAIESGALEYVCQLYLARGRDAAIKSEENVGVRRVDYWVGDIGEPGQLPPSVIAKIAPFRRVQV